MTDRLAALRALHIEKEACREVGGWRFDFENAMYHREICKSADALLDCAEALPLMINQLKSALMLLKCDDEFIAAQTEKACTALAKLNGDSNGQA